VKDISVRVFRYSPGEARQGVWRRPGVGVIAEEECARRRNVAGQGGKAVGGGVVELVGLEAARVRVVQVDTLALAG